MSSFAPSKTERWLGLLVLTLCAVQIARFWFLCDDAYISFRYARNWAMGFGLRYNLGDHVPVEGYSNFLWVAWAAVFEWMQLDVGHSACGLHMPGVSAGVVQHRDRRDGGAPAVVWGLGHGEERGWYVHRTDSR